MDKEQTAVEWLIEQLGGNGHISTYESIKRDELQSIIEKAKAMHKEEIAKSHFEGANKLSQGKNVNGYEYYEQTYGKKQTAVE